MRNAFANVIRGSFSALIAVLLPPFLVRTLPTETFSVWVLILQLTAYINYLDFGVQTAVGRFVAKLYADAGAAYRHLSTALDTLFILEA